LSGKTVLITSGPTQEPIDSVRFLSNRSSGKMGAALARAALLLGAKVVVISGPTKVPLPLDAEVVRVQTAVEMRDAALRFADEADLVIGAAAVADYRPVSPSSGKIRRTAHNLSLELTPNPDVIAEFAKASRARVVGFAAEPTTDLAEVRAKLERKGLFAVAANDIRRSDAGFDSDKNELTLVRRDGEPISSGHQSKLGCALWLLEQVAD
jgi:phosphopantothenoylcysteine decarboxylase/phosphopantothenate--cysteine ligase